MGNILNLCHSLYMIFIILEYSTTSAMFHSRSTFVVVVTHGPLTILLLQSCPARRTAYIIGTESRVLTTHVKI